MSMQFRTAVMLVLIAAKSAAATPPRRLLATAHVPGAAVAVVDGSRISVANYGVADSESQERVTGTTVFEAASIGKVVFAYAVLKLATDGRFDLDKPLQSYLATPYGSDPRLGRITGRMVLTHRTGLPNWRGGNQELVPSSDPGTRFGYSGEGFLFLQKAVETIVGPIEPFMRASVFEPLRMRHSSYIWLPEYDRAKAWGHDAEGARWRRRKPEGANVAATLHTTAEDLALFLRALMEARGLSAEMHHLLFTPQVDAAPHIGWGLGVGLYSHARRLYFWHWGDDGDFKGYVFGDMSRRRAAVVLTNGANGLQIAADLAAGALHIDAATVAAPLEWLGYTEHRSPAAFVEPRTGMRFVLIRAGSFDMGSPAREPGHRPDEKLHRVTLRRPFYMSETEVTQAEWRRIMNSDPSHFHGDNLPVERISWNDAQTFIARLNAAGTRRYRLPSEAEWEYACRAGSSDAYNTGARLTTAQANYDGRYPLPGQRRGIHRDRTTPVRHFRANTWGLYDMHGNVWEWCADEYCPYPDAAAEDPLQSCGSPYNVIRGGSWYFNADSARSALRYTHEPQLSGFSIGMRVVREVPSAGD